VKIYTKTGDCGMTGLFAGGRVPKDHPRIAAYGSVDELNALLGIVTTHAAEALRARGAQQPAESALLQRLAEMIERMQHDLFAIGAELATPDPDKHGTRMLQAADIARLEQWIDELEESLTPLANFILPGGSVLAGWLHWARTVCRRAERDVVHLAAQPEVADCSTPIVYLNRLSDLLFVMARAANHAVGLPDVPWQKPTVVS
jgi:cob(I)alamin adenosyltransferase